MFWLVTAGLLVRAVGGQLAFWISYLHLPIARSLQAGNGLWFFARDAATYVDIAKEVAAVGPKAILYLDRTTPSVFFVQSLAFAFLLLGTVSTTAILLNLLAYLGSCRAILSFGDPSKNRTVVFAIAAISLSPSAILWAVQPLKDTYFLLLVAVFFSAALAWQRILTASSSWRRLGAAAGWVAVMACVVYGISGIRWYFGFMIFAAVLPFVLVTILSATQRKMAFVSAAILVFGVGFAFFAGAGPYIWPELDAAILKHDVKQQMAMPATVFRKLESVRDGMETTPGATLIGAGEALRKIDDRLGVSEPRIAPIREEGVQPRMKLSDPSLMPPPEVPDALRNQDRNPPPAARPPVVLAGSPPPATAGAAVEGGAIGGRVAVPGSRPARLLAGSAALVLPHFIAQRIGIIDVRGGRGLWMFVELDTAYFDVVLVIAMFAVIGAMRRQALLRSPVFWMTLIVFVSFSASLAYAVSNFGTLFRHRGMIQLGLVLLPIAALGSVAAEERRAQA